MTAIQWPPGSAHLARPRTGLCGEHDQRPIDDGWCNNYTDARFVFGRCFNQTV